MIRRAHILLLALLTAPLAAQTTRTVPSSTYPTVQSAIDASTTGDNVSVLPGTYPEHLVISGKSLTLQSTTGAASTVLDGSLNGTVLTVSGVAAIGTSVTGFTLQNGRAVANPGAAVTVNDASVTLASDIFQANSGNTVDVTAGTLTLTNSTLTTVPSSFYSCSGQIAVDVHGPSTVRDTNGLSVPVTLTGNTITGDGTPCSGTAISLATTGFSTPHLIQNNILRGNGLALALAVDDGTTTGTGALIIQNLITGSANGAVTLTAPSTPSLDPPTVLFLNNTVANNLLAPTTALADITLTGTASRTAFLNNLLLGASTTLPVLSCTTATPTLNLTPLILDHTDLFNPLTTPSHPAITGDCFPRQPHPLAVNGNLSADPLLSTTLTPLPSSPALDAGINSAPSLPATDLAGNPRILDATGLGYPVIDLGAFELTGTADAAPTTINLTSSTYETGPTSAVSLTATVSTYAPGTITFFSNGTQLASSAAILGSVQNVTLPSGLADITATYTPTGSTAIAPAVSPVRYVNVLTGTALTITASSTSNVAGQPVLLTVHLTAADGTVPPGAVFLTDTLAGTTTPLTPLQPDATGLATVTVYPAAGTHIYTVTYSGTHTDSPATASTSLTLAAAGTTATTLTAAPTPGLLGSPVTLTATVTSPSSTTPTGSVLFTADNQPLTTVAVTNGTAILSTSTLTAGTHHLAAAFTSTAGFTSSSAAATLTVLVPTATTLTTPNPTATTSDAVPYTVTVTFPGPTYGSTGPTGTVTLTDGSTLLASAALTPISASTSTAHFTVIDPTPAPAPSPPSISPPPTSPPPPPLSPSRSPPPPPPPSPSPPPPTPPPSPPRSPLPSPSPTPPSAPPSPSSTAPPRSPSPARPPPPPTPSPPAPLPSAPTR